MRVVSLAAMPLGILLPVQADEGWSGTYLASNAVAGHLWYDGDQPGSPDDLSWTVVFVSTTETEACQQPEHPLLTLYAPADGGVRLQTHCLPPSAIHHERNLSRVQFELEGVGEVTADYRTLPLPLVNEFYSSVGRGQSTYETQVYGFAAPPCVVTGFFEGEPMDGAGLIAEHALVTLTSS